MLVPGRRISWQQKLRQTKAIEALKAGRPDLFPLAEVQRIGDWLIMNKPPSSFRRRAILPHTEECDQVLANELLMVKGELPIHQVSIVAFLHLFSYDQARGQVFSLRPSPDPTVVFFDHKLSAYLQCIILSARANPDVCSEDEVTAAQEPLGVAKGRARDFPSILRLLQAVGHGTCETLLPVALVKKVLKNSHNRDNLIKELESLRRQRRWFDAYKLAHHLRNVIGLARADKLLRDIFPQYPMWAAWRPNVQRITSWEGAHLAPYRKQLGSVLDLEGPDTTGQQRGTLRVSSPGAFAGLGRPGFSDDRHILDRLLYDLDTCLGIGPATVDLLIALCIESNSLSSRSLDQLEAGMSLRHDPSSKALADLVRSITSGTNVAIASSGFASALPIITTHSQLRKQFGIANDLPRRGPTSLSAAQSQFCQSLAGNRPSERLAMSVLALGTALLHAEWLHEYWQPAYITMLRGLPTEQETQSMLHMLENTPSSSTRLGTLDFLATRIGGTLLHRTPSSTSSISTHPSSSLPPSSLSSTASPFIPPTPAMIPKSPIWYTNLDIERDNLRRLLRSPAMKDLDTTITTACLNQSLSESDGFIREICRIMIGNTDQVCVNMAQFLGNWIMPASGTHFLHESWRGLLLNMMRVRLSGLLDRCAEQLTLGTWENWVGSLQRVFADHRYLEMIPGGRTGVVGFTDEAIGEWTWKKGRGGGGLW